MTRARLPRPQEIIAASVDPRLRGAVQERELVPGLDDSWRLRGACRVLDPEVFFPAPHEPAEPALRVCATCTVAAACLAAALDLGDCHGVWGATTARERRAMLVAWRHEQGGTRPRGDAASLAHT